jgi:hypothetical protein
MAAVAAAKSAIYTARRVRVLVLKLIAPCIPAGSGMRCVARDGVLLFAYREYANL